MKREDMEPNQRYLLRLFGEGGPQVPVIYDGYGLWSKQGGEEGKKRNAFTRLDTGDWLFTKTTHLVSRHYDSCVNAGTPGRCNCRAKLESITKENQQPT